MSVVSTPAAMPTPELRVGAPWRHHSEVELIDCAGRFFFFDLSHKAIAEARCDECGCEWTVHKTDALADLQPREERWYQR